MVGTLRQSNFTGMPPANSPQPYAHLLRRAGFGGTPDEIARVRQDGLAATVDRLLSPPAPEPSVDTAGSLEEIQAWWIDRMLHTEHPLQEKMTLFWHGHFATSFYKVDRPGLLWRQNETLRRLAFGDFRDMLGAMARDPAMLMWLDGVSNHAHAPNENWARELMELFTIGVGRYTEADVQASARAFSGWGLKDDEFYFDVSDHVPGVKHFLGHDVENGDEVLDILANHPETGRFIGRKLFEFFAYAPAPQDAVEHMATVYRTSGRHMGQAMRALLLSPWFLDAEGRRVKSPTEFAVAAVRLTSSTLPVSDMPAAITRMGQDLFNPPTVKGWDEGMAWISSAAMLERFNFAWRVAAQTPDPANLRVLDDVVQLPVHAERHAILAQAADPVERIHLALSLPECQFC